MVLLWTRTFIRCSLIRYVFVNYTVSTDASIELHRHSLGRLTPQGISLNGQQHIQSACNNAGPLVDFDQHQLWTIVGEWTPAMTDCAKYLNGRGVGARFDGTIRPGAPVHGSCAGNTGLGSTFTPSFKDFLRKTWEAQVSPACGSCHSRRLGG